MKTTSSAGRWPAAGRGLRAVLGLALAGIAGAAGPAGAQRTPAAERPGQESAPGWIGIAYEPSTLARPGSAAAGSLLVISAVVDGSPAAAAGVLAGDTLLRINGRAATPARFRALGAGLRAGDPVRLQLRRQGGTREVGVVAAPRPAFALAVPPEAMAVRIDSVRRSILRSLDSLRLQAESPAPGTRVRLRTEGGARLLPGGRLTLVLEGDSTLPAEAFSFEDFAVGWEGADSVVAELGRLQAAIQSARDVRWFQAGEGPAPSPARPRAVVAPGAPVRSVTAYVVGQNWVAGAQVTPLNPALAEYFAVAEGMLVTDVPAGTPAADAGLLPGDVIVEAGSRRVRGPSDLRAGLAGASRPVELTVVRKGQRLPIVLPYD